MWPSVSLLLGRWRGCSTAHVGCGICTFPSCFTQRPAGMSAVWQQVPATCHRQLADHLVLLGAIKVRSHKYSFSSCWYMGSSQMWLKCNCGLSWAAAGYQGLTSPPILATGLLESWSWSCFPSRVPRSVISFGWALVLRPSLSKVSDLRSATGFVSWQSDKHQSPFCSPQHSISTGTMQDILCFVGHTLVLYLSRVRLQYVPGVPGGSLVRQWPSVLHQCCAWGRSSLVRRLFKWSVKPTCLQVQFVRSGLCGFASPELSQSWR